MDEKQLQARRTQKKKGAAAQGLQGNVATSGQGLLTDAQTTEPTLLG